MMGGPEARRALEHPDGVNQALLLGPWFYSADGWPYSIQARHMGAIGP
jgi:hypothetical protein